MMTSLPVWPRALAAPAKVLPALTVVVLLAWACAGNPPPHDGAPAADATATAAAPPEPTVAPATQPAGDPDPEWQTDPEGRRYQLEAYPKSYAHQRLDDNRLRTVWGIVADIDAEDDENFYLRVYESVPETSPPPARNVPPSEELLASYRVEVPRVDRLSFAPFDTGLPKRGQWRNGMAIADMDGDGKLDIAHGPPRKGGGGPVIFLGDGQGNWRRWDASFPSYPYDYGDAAAGDLDGDGRTDLVLACHLRGLVALVQKQPGKFELWSEGLPFRARSDDELGFSSRALALVDWNQDRRLDIAALNEGPQGLLDRGPRKSEQASLAVVVFLNGGDGSWRVNPLGGGGARGLFGDHLRVADLDRDRRPDLVVASNVQGRRDLVFLAGKGKDSAGDQLELANARPAYTRAVAAADLMGDKGAEVALAFLSSEIRGQWRTGIDVFQRTGDGGWQRQLVWVEEGRKGIWSLAAGDVDGDRRQDLAAITGDGRLIVLLGDGRGGFALQDPSVGQPAEGCHGYGLELVDLDGDGAAEIVADFAGERAGFPGVMEEPGCPDGGSLRVWKATPRHPR